MKKYFLIVVVGLLFVSSLSACTQGNTRADSTDYVVFEETVTNDNEKNTEVGNADNSQPELEVTQDVETKTQSQEGDQQSSNAGIMSDSEECVAYPDYEYAPDSEYAYVPDSECEYIPYPDYNSEEYGTIQESGFVSAKGQPVYTFSADVDTASYSNIRRMIYDGYEMEDIPSDAVRIEEMVNYFSYDYKKPLRNEPFGVTMEVANCPWNEDSELLMIGLQTKDIDFTESAPSNLVFLIDVSGSMYDEDKLPLLQESFELLTENLTYKDRISIVTYAGYDEVLIEGVRGNDTQTIVSALESLSASGSTAGSDGIVTAYNLAEEYFIEDGNNRVILATDGDLNVGLTTEEELEALISEEKETGVFLSVLGFGTDNLKDNKLETLADKGNGNYAYIDSLIEANKVLVEEMGATLVTVAKDVKFQLTFNPDVVEGYRIIGYENRALTNEEFTDDSKDAGEIGAGHSVTLLCELILQDDYEENGWAWADLSVRYKEPEGTNSKELNYKVNAKQFTKTPSDEWIFAGAVAEFGMLLRDSEYKNEASLEHVYYILEESDLEGDSYKEEFQDMIALLYD